MASEGLEEMFKGDYADTCAGKIPLVSMGVRAKCPACADTGARTPIGASGIWDKICDKQTERKKEGQTDSSVYKHALACKNSL